MTISNGGPPLDEDGTPKLRVIRIHINDWVASTRGMSLDEEGFFWRFTCLFYDRMGTLPDDDAMVARAMSLEIRTYKRMKAIMIARGKIMVDERSLTNSRAMREINDYLREYKRRSDAAKLREENKRSVQRSGELSAEVQPKLAGSSPEVRPKSEELPSYLEAELFKNINEINERTATTLAQDDHEPRARARLPKPKPKPLSEVSTPLPPKGGSHPLEVRFEEFWVAFPPGRKRAKGAAMEAFCKIVTGTHRKGLRAKADELIAGAIRYAASKPDPEYVPMPGTWLNEGRWMDDVADAKPLVGPNGKSWGWWVGQEDTLRKLSMERWRAAIAKNPPNGSWPWWLFGPPAGSAECLMPAELVDEMGYATKYKGSIEHV